MIHQPLGGFGQATEMTSMPGNSQDRERLNEIMAKHTGQQIENRA